jgi:AcrR family transcriptional regulator
METPDGRRTETRNNLVETAVRLFRSRGVSGTGIDLICRDAGVSKGVFAHHFPGGKHELIAASIERDALDMTAMLYRIYEREGRSVAGLVHGLFGSYGRLIQKYGWSYGCPVAAVAVESGASPEDAELAGVAFASWRASLAALDDELDPSIATLILSAFEGAILLARAERSTEIFDQVGESLARLIDAETAVHGRALERTR